MSSGSRAARKGFQNEAEFVCLVNNNPNFRCKLSEHINDNLVGAKKSTDPRAKPDVDLLLGNCRLHGCSLKNFDGTKGRPGFNQIDRRWLSDLMRLLRNQSIHIPQDLESEMEKSILAKAKNPRSLPLMSEGIQSKVCDFFSV